MVDYLATIRRFLELNPGQVIILFDEDYVAERDLESAFKRAGLFRRLARLQAGRPLPTLGQLIASRHNIVVFAQQICVGLKRLQLDPGHSNARQETDEFSCKLYRGRASKPLADDE